MNVWKKVQNNSECKDVKLQKVMQKVADKMNRLYKKHKIIYADINLCDDFGMAVLTIRAKRENEFVIQDYKFVEALSERKQPETKISKNK